MCIVAALIASPGFKILQNSESRAASRMGKVSEFCYMDALVHCPPPGPIGLFLTGLIPAFIERTWFCPLLAYITVIVPRDERNQILIH